jgi:hypothetical protein
MMNSDASMAVGFFVSAASIAWSAAFAWSRWLGRPRQQATADTRDQPHRLEQRLEGIEQVVQAIALEVERLGEGQRFTTRLLAERLAVDAPPRLHSEHRRVDTPH